MGHPLCEKALTIRATLRALGSQCNDIAVNGICE